MTLSVFLCMLPIGKILDAQNPINAAADLLQIFRVFSEYVNATVTDY